ARHDDLPARHAGGGLHQRQAGREGGAGALPQRAHPWRVAGLVRVRPCQPAASPARPEAARQAGRPDSVSEIDATPSGSLAMQSTGSRVATWNFESGLSVSEISYGNWLTHGSQVEEDQAHACIKAALDAGITTFDTADVYANTAAESVLGRGLQDQRRESLEIFTKVFWPTGPKGPNDKGLGRKHIMESAHASLRRLGTDYVDLYQAHRFDHTTPLEETMLAFADLVRQDKVLYVGVSEWTAEQITRGA